MRNHIEETAELSRLIGELDQAGRDQLRALMLTILQHERHTTLTRRVWDECPMRGVTIVIGLREWIED